MQIPVGGLVGKAGTFGDLVRSDKLRVLLQIVTDQLKCGAADPLRQNRLFALGRGNLLLALEQPDVQADAGDQVRGLDRFEREVGRTRLQKPVGDLLVLVDGKDEDRHSGGKPAEHPHPLDPVDPRQVVVDQHDIRLMLPEERQPFLHICGHHRVPVFKIEDRPERIADFRFIVD